MRDGEKRQRGPSPAEGSAGRLPSADAGTLCSDAREIQAARVPRRSAEPSILDRNLFPVLRDDRDSEKRPRINDAVG
jgi:hypothetical protein